jgi:hypothetical protein
MSSGHTRGGRDAERIVVLSPHVPQLEHAFTLLPVEAHSGTGGRGRCSHCINDKNKFGKTCSSSRADRGRQDDPAAELEQQGLAAFPRSRVQLFRTSPRRGGLRGPIAPLPPDARKVGRFLPRTRIGLATFFDRGIPDTGVCAADQLEDKLYTAPVTSFATRPRCFSPSMGRFTKPTANANRI